jgi:glycosyltransferase involved in cell wall biosynthesis
VGIIGPAHGAFPELLVDQQEGRLFEPGSAPSLAEMFHDAESAPERYADYGTNARRAYESRFDPEDNIDQLVSIYQYAVNNPARSADSREATLGRAAVGAPSARLRKTRTP